MTTQHEFAKVCYEQSLQGSPGYHFKWEDLDKSSCEQVARLCDAALDQVIELRWVVWQVEFIMPGEIQSERTWVLAASDNDAYEEMKAANPAATVLSIDRRDAVDCPPKPVEFYPAGAIHPGAVLDDLGRVDGYLRAGVKTLDTVDGRIPKPFVDALEWCGRMGRKLYRNVSANN